MTSDAVTRLKQAALRTPPGRWYADSHRLAALAGKLWQEPGHFYSPIPDLDDVARHADKIYPTQETALRVPGVDLRLEAQHELLDRLEPLLDGVDFPATREAAASRGRRYFTDNDSYGSGDGIFLTLLLRYLTPDRLIELGSGYSTACTLDARDEWLPKLDVTLIEPYPDTLGTVMRTADWSSVRHLKVGTQDADLATFEELGAGDILFIDSTHVAKTGSDVTWIFGEVLPRLAPGVWIHIHDIFPRFEYPPAWVEQGRGWTEAYLLRAFLAFNSEFQIELWPNLLRALEPDQMLARFPQLLNNGGGAIWLSRR